MVAPARSGWGPCPHGELQRLSQRLTVRRRRRHTLTIVAGTVLAALAAGAGATGLSYTLEWWASGQAAGHCAPIVTPTPSPAPPPAPAPAPASAPGAMAAPVNNASSCSTTTK
jgi:hypothetical protein